MKKILKKINKIIEKYSLGIQVGLFFVLLSEILHFLKYSKLSVDIMAVEIFALIFIVLILNIYNEEKNKKKKILKIVGFVLLFLIIAFQFLAEYII